MGKFITPKRLETFWVTAVSKLTEGVNGKKLSSNDLTDELKEQYDKAESNKIDSISVNGEKQTIDTDKNVNIEFDAGTGIQDITQEEYDALSEEEKMGDTIYHITDAEDDNVIVNVMLGETSETAYAGDKGKLLADKIGDTDISDISDGTVTGAISRMNSNLGTNSSSNIFQLKTPDFLGISAYANYGGTEYSITGDVFSGINYGGYAWNFDTMVGETYTITLSNPANKKIFAGNNESTSEGTKSLTFTASSTVTKLGVLYAYNAGTTPNTKIQINVGNESLDYETYNGYSNMQLTDILSSLTYPNAGAHNSIYRGKNLGTSYTAEQKAQIQAGTFNDLYIGDYWVIDGVTWRIAHFDYWLNTGDTNCTTHHAVIVPDTVLYKATMNDTSTTTGAYAGSKMYTENLETAKTTIDSVFGSANILIHREHLANATNDTTDPAYESACSWYDSTVELMNECMVYGSNIFHNIEVNGVIPTNYTIDKSQLALFSLDPSKICNRTTWWLRDVVSSTYFAYVSSYGITECDGAYNTLGVRPVFGIC